jgi:hypothetical protein
MEINYKAIGYLNGVAYNLIDFDLGNNTGLVQLKEWIFPVWCTFDKIINKSLKLLKNCNNA